MASLDAKRHTVASGEEWEVARFLLPGKKKKKSHHRVRKEGQAAKMTEQYNGLEVQS